MAVSLTGRIYAVGPHYAQKSFAVVRALRRVGVCHYAVVGIEYRRRVIASRHSGHYAFAMPQTVVVYSASVEVRACIEGYLSLFDYGGVVAYSSGSKCKSCGEAKRTVVEYFGLVIAPRHCYGVIVKYRRHARSESGSHGVAVHAQSMVYVVGKCIDEILSHGGVYTA